MKTLFISLLVLLSIVTNVQGAEIICAHINGSKKLVPYNAPAIKLATELELKTCGNGKNNLRFLETAKRRKHTVKAVSVTRAEFLAARAKLAKAMNTGTGTGWFN